MNHLPNLPELSEFPVVITIPVQWGDQDALGHVNNTVPIRWFESARVAYLESIGITHIHSGESIGPILAAVTCNFRQQLSYPDTVHIGASITRMGNSSLTMIHRVYSEALHGVAVEGESVVVAFNYREQKSVRVPDAMRAAIEKLEGKSL